MNNIFKKIPLNFSDLELKNLKGHLIGAYGPTFKEYTVKNLDYVLEYIKPKIKFNLLPDDSNITQIHSPGAGPHCDRWKTALNLYLETGPGDVTTYYKEKNKSNEKFIGNTGIKVYEKNNLEKIGSFIAETGDCYLINTHEPHTVILKKDNSVRTILRFIWLNKPFNDVLDSIEL